MNVAGVHLRTFKNQTALANMGERPIFCFKYDESFSFTDPEYFQTIEEKLSRFWLAKPILFEFSYFASSVKYLGLS